MTRPADATEPEIVEARRGALVAAVIAIAGEGSIAVSDARSLGFGPLVFVRLAHVALATCALAILLVRRRSVRVAEIAFALVVIPFLPVLMLSEIEFAAHHQVREHGSWYKLTMLGIAALAPASPGLPATVVVALGVQRVVLRFVLGSQPTVPGEPWITLIFAAIAVGMLVSRAHRREAVARAARVAARAAALDRMTRLLLGIRDRANTPLQTIAFGAAVVARRCTDQQRIARAMENAVVRLRRLSNALQRASREIDQAAREARDGSR